MNRVIPIGVAALLGSWVLHVFLSTESEKFVAGIVWLLGNEQFAIVLFVSASACVLMGCFWVLQIFVELTPLNISVDLSGAEETGGFRVHRYSVLLPDLR